MQLKVLQLNADTIAAVATAQGRGGIGVVRISGQHIESLVYEILGKLPVARQATYSKFLDENGDALDEGIALFFPAPHSYTGEQVLELQGHGGSMVLQLLLRRCLNLGARIAQPGEFTRRAFLNKKLDLAQAEFVADLIDANSEEAARSAMRSLSGEFSVAIKNMVNDLIQLRMLVEAVLDFPEDELAVPDKKHISFLLCNVQTKLCYTINTARQGCLMREGANVVIVGQPNVGKSSLLNRLAGEELAIVSDAPGTTRDVVRQMIQIRGVPLHIMDTAGLRESEDVVENMGIARTHHMLRRADLILLLLDASIGLTVADQNIFSDLPIDIPRILVINKIDLIDHGVAAFNHICDADITFIKVSAKTSAGIDNLREKILEAIGWREQECGIFMARERHLQALKLAQIHLNLAGEVLANLELLAEELCLAQRALNEISGEFTSDDLLGEIFSRFCIGK